MEIFIYSVVNSLSYASIAIGFALVYGVSRVANFAHGALYVVCGYMAWSIYNSLGLTYWLAAVLSVITVALIGAAIYMVLLIRVRGMPVWEILVSFALGMAILEGLRLQNIGSFKGFIGPGYILPVFIDRTVKIAGVIVDAQRLMIVGVGLTLAFLLWLFTHHTKMGLALRAISQNERAALMLGIDSDWTAAAAMSIGSALVGIAAITILPLGQVTAEAGYEILISAVAICFIGGIGSWGGAILASFLIGFVTTFVAAWGATTYQKMVLFGFIIFILIVKPSGLLGKQKELEERV